MKTFVYRKIKVRGHWRTTKEDKRFYVLSHTRRIKTPAKFIRQSEDVKKKLHPYNKTMVKEVPQHLIKGIKEIATDQEHEYSIGIDFERDLEQPERIYMMKGGKDRTIRLQDFELFGHTHPNHFYPTPSQVDLANMEFLKPEFIVAGRTGNVIFLNIENKDKFQQWYWKYSGKKEIDPENYNYLYFDKDARKKFFEHTGVKAYPMIKPVKLELKDDPIREYKQIRKPPIEMLKKWHEKD